MIKGRIDTWSGNWRSLTPEQYAELRLVTRPPMPEERHEHEYTTYTWDWDALRCAARFGVSVVFEGEADDTATMLVKLRDDVDALRRSHEAADRLVDGSAVQIAIPDLGLLTVRHVQVLNDCCTDDLQRHLDEGWRILAVCPPNAQRRPDYVLGRRDAP